MLVTKSTDSAVILLRTKTHQNACSKKCSFYDLSPHNISMPCSHAIALIQPHKAGRRGGESIARQRWCVILKIIV
ncbi:hypothetical protein DDQ06_15795 [Salmonella enterica]|nr:hypothetical protein [Salmonella enterica]ECZ6693977.1 hypothetical protein [Salmonella enterica]